MTPARVAPRTLRFSTTWRDSLEELKGIMYALGLDDWDIECRQALRGNPDSTKASAEDRAVTLTYTDEGHPVRIVVTSQETATGNLRAIVLAMDSRRLNIIRGIDDAVRASYLALPAPEVERDPWEVLEVRPGASLEVIHGAYRALARARHPDTGGSAEAFAELTKAYERLQTEAQS